ncbi:MAG: AmmeMemoRadiSam system protein B, partial [Candidatus Omnitrophica bacterium CG1_02_46_14]
MPVGRQGRAGFVAALLAMTLIFSSSISFSSQNPVRSPYVAGEFYPADKIELAQMIDGFLATAERTASQLTGRRPVMLILPHAGYVYSGQTAAHGYRLIDKAHYDTVILIGPCHRTSFRGASIWRSGTWQTPLGTVSVDENLAQAIVLESPEFQVDQSVHLKEHSLEVQLPFLQRSLNNFKIVPILTDDSSPENCTRLAQAIYKNIQDKNALIVVSTDMSHFYHDSVARAMDHRTLGFLETQNSRDLTSALKS